MICDNYEGYLLLMDNIKKIVINTLSTKFVLVVNGIKTLSSRRRRDL